MRALTMCLSVLQAPRCKFHSLANSWWENVHGLKGKNRFKLCGLNISGLEGDYSRRWTRRPITTKSEGKNKKLEISKPTIIKHEILEGAISTSTKVEINKTEINEVQAIKYYDIQQKIAKRSDLETLVTVIVFDIETTGLSRENERIVEIALQDLQGGKNSTFQTLVNPGQFVSNSHIHGIETHMVNRPDIPRMEDVIPILQDYVRSRQKQGGYVLWVAHNGRTFDVPFLMKEFSRSSVEIPPDWLFLDTLPLAREMMKAIGSSSGASLQVLREHYRIPLVGSAHRAMSDVNTLALILQRLTFDMKMSIYSLIERSFTASDLINLKKKKTSSAS